MVSLKVRVSRSLRRCLSKKGIRLLLYITAFYMVIIAQLVRAPVRGTGGHKFKSY
jgi:hypothetical protein